MAVFNVRLKKYEKWKDPRHVVVFSLGIGYGQTGSVALQKSAIGMGSLVYIYFQGHSCVFSIYEKYFSS